MKKRYFLLFAIAFLADRLTKWWAVTALADGPRAVCYGFNFDLSWNRGVTWSFLTATNAVGYWLLCGAIAAMIIGFTWYIVRRANLHFPIGWEVLVLAGAVSNLIDRLWYGAVVDFISWYVGSFAWPIFNVADACIVVGMMGLLVKMSWETHD